MLSRELLKKLRAIEIRTRHTVTDDLAGEYHSAFKGQGMEFEEVREYFPGDDVRAIDWNVTARTNQPFIKKFREERELTVFLVVDVSASQVFGTRDRPKSELAAEIAAVLALAAIRNNDRVGLLLHSDQVEHLIPPGKGPRHVLRIIRTILGCEPTSPRSGYSEALSWLNRVAHRRCVVFLIGDFQVPAEELHAITVSARRHDLVALRLHDPAEMELPKLGLVEWLDPETGESQLVDTSSRRVRKAFADQQRSHRAEQDALFRRRKVDLLDMQTNREWHRDLSRFFRFRGRRHSS